MLSDGRGGLARRARSPIVRDTAGMVRARRARVCVRALAQARRGTHGHAHTGTAVAAVRRGGVIAVGAVGPDGTTVTVVSKKTCMEEKLEGSFAVTPAPIQCPNSGGMSVRHAERTGTMCHVSRTLGSSVARDPRSA